MPPDTMDKEFLPFGRPDFSDDEIAAVTRVLRSGWVGMGPETLAFEEELAVRLGARHVVAVNSCTSALFLSLVAEGVGAGDEVICPSLAWCSTANVALHLGAVPVFCDVDRETFCMTPELVTPRVTARTKAVIAVHFGGLAADVERLRAALPKNVAVIEDAAHAFGARYADGTPVGSSGNPTCFSFYANKNLSTGEGGAIALSDEPKAERLRSLRQHGLPTDAWKRFSHPSTLVPGEACELGYKMNYTDLQASIGRVQLRRQPRFDAVRLEIARRYHERLPEILPEVALQAHVLREGHSRHLFAVVLPIERMPVTRDELLLDLRARNIGVNIHYAPLHSMPLYAGRPQPRLPHTEWLSRRIMTLPIGARMGLRDADRVLAQIDASVGRLAGSPGAA